MSERERLDDLQIGGYHLWQDPAFFCFGIDSVLLSEFVRVKDDGTVLDLGTGNGVLLFLLAAKTKASRLTGLEILPEAVRLAEKSIAENGLEGRVRVVAGDLCGASRLFGENAFDVVVSNPPYRKKESGRISPVYEKAVARHEVAMTLADLTRETAKVLVPGGRVYIVYPAARREELLAQLRADGLTPVRVRPVRSLPETPPHLVLAEAVKGEGEGFAEEPALVIYERPGVYSREVRAVYDRN